MTRLQRLSRWMQEGGLYALLVLLPFSKAAIELCFGVIFFGWLIARLHPATRRDTVWLRPSLRWLALSIGGFLLVCALSIVVSEYPPLSLRGFIGKWLEYLLFFVIVTDTAWRPGVAERSLGAFLASSCFVVVEGIWQERYGAGLFLRHRLDFFRRMTGPYENPIDLATYLMMVIPASVGYVAARRSRSQWWLWAWLLVLVVCLGRTQSVGAWVGLGLGLMAIGMRSARIRRAALVLCALATLAGGLFLVRSGHLSHVYAADIGKHDRVMMWQAALAMVRDRPFLGHGVNTFMALYLDYWVGGEHQPRYAHNCYLQMAAETGLLGLLSFLALLWFLGASLFTATSRIRSDGQLRLVGLLGGLFAFVIQAGVDTNFYAMRQVALFWVLAGLAVGVSLGYAPTASDGCSSSGSPLPSRIPDHLASPTPLGVSQQ